MDKLPEVKTQENATRKNGNYSLVFFVMFGLFAIVLVALGDVYLYFKLKSVERHSANLSSQVMQQAQTITATQTTLQGLTQPQEKRTRALAEAEYLVKLASLDLDFEGNIPLAIHLLQTADQQLAKLNDTSLNDIRRLILEDVTTLQATPAQDLSGLILKISAISQEIGKLPVIAQPIKTVIKPNTTTHDVSQPLWRRGLDSMGHALKDMVVVRHLEHPVEPFLLPELRSYLLINIQLKLSQAEWAALHQQPQIYSESLQQAKQWVQQYFVQNDKATQNVINELDALEKANVKPPLPDISKSLNAIESFFNPTPVKPSATAVTVTSFNL